ncbi:putative glycosyltransferase [Rhodococcus sp. 27YEA15]
MSRLKIVLYSHDSVGLGHARRNLGIAHRLAQVICRGDFGQWR